MVDSYGLSVFWGAVILIMIAHNPIILRRGILSGGKVRQCLKWYRYLNRICIIRAVALVYALGSVDDVRG